MDGWLCVGSDCIGDMDDDTDLMDSALLASHWLDSECVWPNGCMVVDLNHDGKIDLQDLCYGVTLA